MEGAVTIYILKNALKSITRSKGRNFIIGLIVTIIAISSCVALAINNAAAKTEQQGLASLNITAQISLDRQKIMQDAQAQGTDMRTLMQNYSQLSLSELQKYASSKNVKNFYYTVKSSLKAGGTLKPVDTSSTTTAADSAQSASNKQNRIPGGMGNQGDFTITGYSSESAMTSFVNGSSQITSGKTINTNAAGMDCIINEELATFNGLKVGDTITLANPNNTSETYNLTIAGIYKNVSTGSAVSSNMQFSASTDAANQIYTSYSTLKSMLDNSTANAVTQTNTTTGETTTTALRNQVSGTYVFSDVAKYNAFTSDVKNMGLTNYYTVSSSDVNNYEQSILPLKNLSTFAMYFLLIVLAIGGLILIAFNIFIIRERKFEIGVLSAIGMKKRKVALQFIIEIFIVTLIAIGIGTAAGGAISMPAANKLLASQIAAKQTQSQQVNQNFGRNSQRTQQPGASSQNSTGGFYGFRNQSINYISHLDAAIDLKVIGEILGIGILLTILSSTAAIASVLRYEPLKILAERT